MSGEKWGFPPTEVDMLTGEAVQEAPTSKFPEPEGPTQLSFGNGYVGRVVVRDNGLIALFIPDGDRSLSSTIAIRNALNEAIAYQEARAKP